MSQQALYLTPCASFALFQAASIPLCTSLSLALSLPLSLFLSLSLSLSLCFSLSPSLSLSLSLSLVRPRSPILFLYTLVERERERERERREIVGAFHNDYCFFFYYRMNFDDICSINVIELAFVRRDQWHCFEIRLPIELGYWLHYNPTLGIRIIDILYK